MPPRLEELCVDVIVSRFPRYNGAFKNSSDETLQKMLEFLRRKYSYDILVRLSTIEDSLEEYVDFLVNKHLKSLDTAWFRNCSWEKVISKMAEMGSSIENFSLRKNRSSKFYKQTPWQDIMCYLPNLRNFACHVMNTELILKNIGKYCPNIEQIKFYKSHVTLKSINYLCKSEKRKASCSTKLKKITFLNSVIENESVQHLLNNLPSLDIDYFELYLVLYSLHKNDLPFLSNIAPYKITRLELFPDIMTMNPKLYNDAVKLCLALCPHLKYLNYKLLDKHSIVCSSLPELKQLCIGKCFANSPVININEFLRSVGKTLTFLTINDCTVSVSVLAQSCPHIKELIFNRVNFHFDDYSKPVFNSLLSCTFQCTNVSKNSKVINLLLTSSSKLESLVFENCKLISYGMLNRYTIYRIRLNKISFFDSLKEFSKSILLYAPHLKHLTVKSDFENELLKFTKFLPKGAETDLFPVCIED